MQTFVTMGVQTPPETTLRHSGPEIDLLTLRTRLWDLKITTKFRCFVHLYQFLCELAETLVIKK